MSSPYIVYGQKGSGSVSVEATLLLLGEPYAVDLYVTVVSSWGPRRQRFSREAPGLAAVVQRVDEGPRLQDFWARRFRAP